MRPFRVLDALAFVIEKKQVVDHPHPPVNRVSELQNSEMNAVLITYFRFVSCLHTLHISW